DLGLESIFHQLAVGATGLESFFATSTGCNRSPARRRALIICHQVVVLMVCFSVFRVDLDTIDEEFSSRGSVIIDNRPWLGARFRFLYRGRLRGRDDFRHLIEVHNSNLKSGIPLRNRAPEPRNCRYEM